MTSTLKLSLVIPVYNESENIEECLKTINKNVKVKHEIIVVYDSESDTTLPVLRRLKSKYRNLIVVKNNVSLGPSGAIRTGLKKARSKRILVTMADLCDDLTQVNELLSIVPKQADIASPTRYSAGGKQNLNAKFKVWIPKIAGFLLRLLTGIKTSDPTNSYKLYSSEIFNRFNLSSTISFSVTLEIVAKAHCLGLRIREIPTTWHDRQHGQTNFKLGSSILGYTPWFFLALLRNRFFAFPQSLINSLVENK